MSGKANHLVRHVFFASFFNVEPGFVSSGGDILSKISPPPGRGTRQAGVYPRGVINKW